MDDFFGFAAMGAIGASGGTPRGQEKVGNRNSALETQVAELERRQESMALVCQALLELVREKTGITNEELETKILEVDLRDGKPDGKISAQVLDCPQCGRKVNSKRPRCLYCGTEVRGDHHF